MKARRIALIIDDEKQIRRLLRLALEGADHQVFEAETGQAGLEEIAYRRPDVVLLDLGLARHGRRQGIASASGMVRRSGAHPFRARRAR